ncbi:hypothetical protein GEMRC1_003877 [Eukaryota sp. GEM-RC1]
MVVTRSRARRSSTSSSQTPELVTPSPKRRPRSVSKRATKSSLSSEDSSQSSQTPQPEDNSKSIQKPSSDSLTSLALPRSVVSGPLTSGTTKVVKKATIIAKSRTLQLPTSSVNIVHTSETPQQTRNSKNASDFLELLTDSGRAKRVESKNKVASRQRGGTASFDPMQLF